MGQQFGMIERLKRETVTADDVISVVDAMSEQPPEDRCFEASIGTVADLFPGEHNMDRRMAISFRLTAFSLLVKDSDEHGLSFLKHPDGSVNASEATLAAVAETPLIERDEQLVFDPAELFCRAREYEARETLEKGAS